MLRRRKNSRSSTASRRRNRTSRQARFESLEERRLLAVVSHWAAENTAVDSVGGNDATLVSGASYAGGQVGQAFRFDGVDDRAIVADDPSLALTESMTIEAWVRVDSYPTSGHGLILFRGDDQPGLDAYELTTTPEGAVRFGISNALGQGQRVEAVLATGEFAYVAATLDHASGDMSIYVNGVLMHQKTTTVRPIGELDAGSNPGVGIGNHGGYPATPHNFPFHGLVDELKVHDQALSHAEVQVNFYATKGDLLPSITISDASAVEGDSSFSYADTFVTAGSGGLQTPRGIVFGPDGNLYVGSSATDSVLRFDGDTGAFIDEFVASGDGGLDLPKDLVFHEDWLFVSSPLTDSVLRFAAASGDFVDEFIAPGSGGLDHPRGLLFGDDNDLYVATAETKDAVLRYNATTGEFMDEFIPSNDNGLDNPTGLAIGPGGDFFVSSTSANSDNVLRYDANGNFLGTFIRRGAGGLGGPTELIFRSGKLYVVGARSDSILAFDENTGEFLHAVVPTGSGGLDNPSRMLFDGEGRLYVTSRNTDEVLRYADATAATVTLSWPTPDVVTVEFETRDGSAVAPDDYESNTGVVTFAPGATSHAILSTIVADSNAEPDETFTIELSNSVNAVIEDDSAEFTITESRVAIEDVTVHEGGDTAHYRGAFVDGLPGGHFNPLTFGPDGNLYTAVGTGTGYNTVQRYDGATGVFLDSFIDNANGEINGVRDIVFHDTDGLVYVASAYTDEVLRYDATTGDFVDVFVTANSGGIDHPDGMAFGPDVNDDGFAELYVTGWLSHSVVRYDGATGAPLGVYITSGSGGLSYPFAFAFGLDGVYVTSAGTSQVLKYDTDTGAFLGVGASEGLDYPRGLAFGPDGLLYVTSGNNDRIIRYHSDGTYVDDFAPAASGLDAPRSVEFGSEGDLYVTATGNHEILRFGTESEAVFHVTLSSPAVAPTSVEYSTGDGSAEAGSDYALTTGTVIFGPGSTSELVLVPLLDDAVGEPAESFFVNLSNSSGAHILDAQGEATILDDDNVPSDVLYFALNSTANVGGVAAANEDIVAFDGADFRLLFDGSDVGVDGLAIDAFSVISSTEILVSFTSAATVGGVGADDSDVLLFTSTSLGEETSGEFSMYFDGGDVGLTSNSEDVDAVRLLSDGRLIISTTGSPSVPGVSNDRDEDLLAFTPTSLGAVTSGDWAMYFDGSDAGLGGSGVDIDAVGLDSNGKIYLSTTGSFNVGAVAGADEDVFVFDPSSLGSATTGAYQPSLHFDGGTFGLGGFDIKAIDIPMGDPNNAPVAMGETFDVDEDGVLQTPGPGVLANDSDADGDSLTASLVTDVMDGALTLNDDGSFVYTPDGDFAGSDSFTYRATDGLSSSNEVTVAITVNAVNDAPVAAADSYTVDQGAVLSVAAAGVLNNDSDNDGDDLTAEFVSGPTDGQLTLNDDGSFTYTPDETFSGEDSFRYRADDGSTTGNIATVTITVNEVTVASGPKLAHGVVNVGEGWQTITLGNVYDSMVVVATPNYDSSSAPAVVRIRNADLSGNSFEIRVQAAGPVAVGPMDVHYVVVEEGVYTLAEHGVRMEAKKVTSTVTDGSGSWNGQVQSFANTYENPPVVVGQVMSHNDVAWSVFWAAGGSRQQSPTTSDLRVGKHVGEDSNERADETIGYIVIEPSTSGTATIEGLPYVASVGGDSVKGVGDSPSYNYAYNAMPNSKAVVASQARMDGGNGGWAVLYGADPITSSGGALKLAVDEDQSRDTERRHTSEPVAYFIIDPPLPEAVAALSTPSETTEPAAKPIALEPTTVKARPFGGGRRAGMAKLVASEGQRKSPPPSAVDFVLDAWSKTKRREQSEHQLASSLEEAMEDLLSEWK